MNFWWLNPLDKRFGALGGAVFLFYVFIIAAIAMPPFLWLSLLWWKAWLG